MTAWAAEEFDVEIYDYLCDYTINGLIRLRVVVWDNKIQNTFREGVNYDPKKQKKFQIKFAELARKYQMHPEYHNANDIFVCYETIRDQIASKTLWNLRERIHALQKDDIWKIEIIFESVHIFYETDAQIRAHEADGVSKALRQAITDIAREHDKYNVFTNGVSCVFTSRQTLNEKFKGSMFFYTR